VDHVIPSAEVITLLTPTAQKILRTGDQQTACQVAPLTEDVRTVQLVPSVEVATVDVPAAAPTATRVLPFQATPVQVACVGALAAEVQVVPSLLECLNPFTPLPLPLTDIQRLIGAPAQTTSVLMMLPAAVQVMPSGDVCQAAPDPERNNALSIDQATASQFVFEAAVRLVQLMPSGEVITSPAAAAPLLATATKSAAVGDHVTSNH
jgi:hypothetical protein